ncbi:MAG: NADH-quinone oxidoreductase subunit C [Alphaproteobacteria bacterium]|nr:NADH-quinone oxidoreductase subunit C [Alphaproteobacteria bacterium]
MSPLGKLLSDTRPVTRHAPWPRVLAGDATWHAAIGEFCAGRLVLLGLWGERQAVHMALLDEAHSEIAVLTRECQSGTYPSVALHHAPAARLERAIRDLFGLEALGAPDRRRWLDHGAWPLSRPLAVPPTAEIGRQDYAFLAAEGEGLHQIPVGPVHAGIIEPGHFRFNVNGETVVRLEARLGYVHKGIEGLMAGADLARGALLAGRVSGDSTVAYSIAYARAVEAALSAAVPERAHWLRALCAELERIANHLGDIGAICNDASFALMQAHCSALREDVLRAAAACFGHRLMQGSVIPGGMATDIATDGVALLRRLRAEIAARLPDLAELYDTTTSLQDRTVGTGILSPALARAFAAGGFVGRASGRGFDARRAIAYAPYDRLSFEVPVLDAGDVDARVWLRFREVEQSLSLIAQLLDGLPGGPSRAGLPAGEAPAEGMALVESFRGDVLAWLRIGADGRIARCHLRDPSWFQWPLLEAAIEGNIVADFPLCNKSFNCSYSGHDL